MKSAEHLRQLTELFTVGSSAVDKSAGVKRLTPEQIHTRMWEARDAQGLCVFSHRPGNPNGPMLPLDVVHTWYHQAAADKKKASAPTAVADATAGGGAADASA